MKRSEEVPNLEYCIKLKELGFPQNGILKWVNYGEGKWELDTNHNDMMVIDCIAPTVAGMGEILPVGFISRKTGKGGDESFVCESVDYKEGGVGWEIEHTMYPATYADTEANSRAKLIIFLCEAGIISPRRLFSGGQK